MSRVYCQLNPQLQSISPVTTDLLALRPHTAGLVQERHNSSVLAMELRPSRTTQSIYGLE